MQTYLNEIYNHIDTNKHAYNETFISDKKDKNKYNQNSKNINKKINNLSKTKSVLFLNNFFRSDKKTSKTLNNNHNKNKNTNKKINVNPYQKIGNKYILNYALDNLNKYQQNLLIKELEENKKETKAIKSQLAKKSKELVKNKDYKKNLNKIEKSKIFERKFQYDLHR